MKLLRDKGLFEEIHRSGWAYAFRGLQTYATGHGLLLDDFVEATFSYYPKLKCHEQPWVGIFHHQVTINSPLQSDQSWCIDKLLDNKRMQDSIVTLRGIIALTPQLAAYLSSWFGPKVPVMCATHPTDPLVPKWTHNGGRLWQTGHFLRDTRL